ncbi:MAG TPA: TetR/AcrR family transcriptional regulator [Steroidobacteraceae bacterium]|nr:TetR/AcrR family transcriptional regulator [Steroidobacteraceae bacterium]
MAERLTGQAWIDFGLRTLAHDGFTALKADVLARKLGVSRGSFYWHFADLAAYHARVVGAWKQAATEAIISDIEHYASPAERLNALLQRAFARSGALETRMRNWAESSADADQAVSDIDRRRRRYLEQLLVDAGVAPPLAETRAQLLYWTYLGAAFSRSRLQREGLHRMVAELSRTGLAL